MEASIPCGSQSAPNVIAWKYRLGCDGTAEILTLDLNLLPANQVLAMTVFYHFAQGLEHRFSPAAMWRPEILHESTLRRDGNFRFSKTTNGIVF
jgi:hypothetical protein